MTPDEAKRRHDEWYARRDEWVAAMVKAGFRVKPKRLGKGKHPAPAELPVDPEPG
jgi:poly(3-hydroxyalkanoate) synthetase